MNGSLDCWACGAHNDDGAGLNGAFIPEDGDVSICLSCFTVGIFTGDGWATREPTAEEALRSYAHPQVVKARAIAAAVRSAGA